MTQPNQPTPDDTIRAQSQQIQRLSHQINAVKAQRDRNADDAAVFSAENELAAATIAQLTERLTSLIEANANLASEGKGKSAEVTELLERYTKLEEGILQLQNELAEVRATNDSLTEQLAAARIEIGFTSPRSGEVRPA